MVDYSGLPTALRAGAQTWIEHGTKPGSFLYAVIVNDLSQAFARADEGNRDRMFQIVSWWYNQAPCWSWGSIDKANRWAAARERDWQTTISGATQHAAQEEGGSQ